MIFQTPGAREKTHVDTMKICTEYSPNIPCSTWLLQQQKKAVIGVKKLKKVDGVICDDNQDWLKKRSIKIY